MDEGQIKANLHRNTKAFRHKKREVKPVKRYKPKKVKRLGHGVNYENRKQKYVLSDLTKKGEL